MANKAVECVVTTFVSFIDVFPFDVWAWLNKELPLLSHLVSYLCSLPVLFHAQLHEGWIRTKSGKDVSVKAKHAAPRPKTSKYVGIHRIRQQLSPSSDV